MDAVPTNTKNTNTKKKMATTDPASLRRNARVVDATSVVMVVSGAAPFLLTGLPHRPGEIAETEARLPTEDGIFGKCGKLLGEYIVQRLRFKK